MTWLERFCLAVLLCVVLLLVTQPAHADEALARRLAALRSLVDPVAAREAVSAAPTLDGCPTTPWWRMTPSGGRSRMERAIRDASLRYSVDPELIHAVIRTESNYDPDAVSHKGAMGLMQLMPRTARGLGVACAFDPRENVLGGTRYLRELRDRLGSWPRALAGYHAGPGRVEAGLVPQITHRYVRRVMGFWKPERDASAVSLDLG